MTPGGPTIDPDGTGGHGPEAVGRAVVEGMLCVRRGESVLLTLPAATGDAFHDAVLAALATRGAEVETVELDAAAPEEAERRLADRLGRRWPDAIVELADLSLHQSEAMRGYIDGGGRVLSLPRVAGADADRLIGGLDLGAMRARQSALVEVLRGARTIVVETPGCRPLRFRLDPGRTTRRLRESLRLPAGLVFGATPIPLVRAQLAFLVGQASFLGRRGSGTGSFRADAFLSPPIRRGRIAAPVELVVRGGRVVDARGPLAEEVRARLRGGAAIEHVSIGFLPSATFDGGLLEAERVMGSVTIGFGRFPWHTDAVASDATLLVDGRPLIERGVLRDPPAVRSVAGPRRRGLLARAAAQVRGVPLRRFATDGGSIAFAGPCGQEGAWLQRIAGRPLHPVESGRVGRGGLAARLAGANVAVVHLDPARLRRELGAFGGLAVPPLVQQELSLDEVARRGFDAMAVGGNARKDLKAMRKAGLRHRARPLDDESLDRFYERYYVPQLRERYGGLAGFAGREVLATHIGSGEFIEILDGETPVAARILGISGARAHLVQAGLLDGDQRHRDSGAIAATYLFGALRACERGATTLALGGSLPFLNDGVLAFKGKWGATLVLPPDQECYRVRIDLSSPAGRAFLARAPVIGRTRSGTTTAVGAVGDRAAAEALRRMAVAGLRRIVAIAPASAVADVADALRGDHETMALAEEAADWDAVAGA